ncbi:MAG: holin, partial [Clostridiales bacterium]|nr:holin [Clostridiales bacterium]
MNKEWLKAALIRAIKTMAQTALSMITVGMAIKDIDWIQLISITLVAGLYSILTSIAGLPETAKGTIIMNTEVDPNSGLKGYSTNSVDTYIMNNQLHADVKISDNMANGLRILTDGLYVNT